MKGYYYLAQAQLALHHPNEALNSAVTAYHECLNTGSSSTANVSALVLQAKKEKWETKERDRLRRRSDLLRELEDGLQQFALYERKNINARMRNGGLSQSGAQEEEQELEASTRHKLDELRSVFAVADPENMQRRVKHQSEIVNPLPADQWVVGGARLPNRQHHVQRDA